MFCIPVIVSASQMLPPEIPVLFYGNANIDDKPVAVNAVISVKTKANNIKIADSAVKNINGYFIEVPCQNYIGQGILFNISGLTAGESNCPDVQTIPSIKLDLIAYTPAATKEKDEDKNISNSSGAIYFAPAPCAKVIYDEWQEACVNNLQYRNIISRTPDNCAMTAEQKAQTKRECGISGIGGEEIKVLGAEFYPDNSLIRGSGMKIYLIENQFKRHIVSLEALKRFAGMEIFNVGNEIIDLYPTGDKIFKQSYKDKDLIRGNDMKIYVIKNNKKHHIINLAELQKYAGQKIYNVSDNKLLQY